MGGGKKKVCNIKNTGREGVVKTERRSVRSVMGLVFTRFSKEMLFFFLHCLCFYIHMPHYFDKNSIHNKWLPKDDVKPVFYKFC